MKYKGFVIAPVYSMCADWKLDKNGTVVPKRKLKSDIEYYEILDPMQDNKRWIAENSVFDCRYEIDIFLRSAGMKDNSQKSWDLLS